MSRGGGRGHGAVALRLGVVQQLWWRRWRQPYGEGWRQGEVEMRGAAAWGGAHEVRQPSPAPSLYRRPGGCAPPPSRAGGKGGGLPPKQALGLGFWVAGPLPSWAPRMGPLGLWCGWPMRPVHHRFKSCGPHTPMGPTSRPL